MRTYFCKLNIIASSIYVLPAAGLGLAVCREGQTFLLAASAIPGIFLAKYCLEHLPFRPWLCLSASLWLLAYAFIFLRRHCASRTFFGRQFFYPAVFDIPGRKSRSTPPERCRFSYVHISVSLLPYADILPVRRRYGFPRGNDSRRVCHKRKASAFYSLFYRIRGQNEAIQIRKQQNIYLYLFLSRGFLCRYNQKFRFCRRLSAAYHRRRYRRRIVCRSRSHRFLRFKTGNLRKRNLFYLYHRTGRHVLRSLQRRYFRCLLR